MTTTQYPATYADIEALPEHLRGELIGGTLYVSARPAGPHLLAAYALGSLLFDPYHRGRVGPGGWWILPEPELRLGADTLMPDLAGWRREKLPRLPQNHIFDVAPDWVCEIMSPSTRKADRTQKPPVYLREKVSYLWLLDPLSRSLEVFHWKEEAWMVAGLFEDDALVKAPPFEEEEIDLLLLWGETREAPSGT